MTVEKKKKTKLDTPPLVHSTHGTWFRKADTWQDQGTTMGKATTSWLHSRSPSNIPKGWDFDFRTIKFMCWKPSVQNNIYFCILQILQYCLYRLYRQSLPPHDLALICIVSCEALYKHVSFQIMSSQLNLPQVGFNHCVESSQSLSYSVTGNGLCWCNINNYM